MSDNEEEPRNVVLPWARGFRPPTRAQALQAVLARGESVPPSAFRALPQHYSVPQPSYDQDWLHLYREDGQTFREYVEERMPRPKQIGKSGRARGAGLAAARAKAREATGEGFEMSLQPVNLSVDSEFLAKLVHFSSVALCCEVKVLPPLDFDLRSEALERAQAGEGIETAQEWYYWATQKKGGAHKGTKPEWLACCDPETQDNVVRMVAQAAGANGGITEQAKLEIATKFKLQPKQMKELLTWIDSCSQGEAGQDEKKETEKQKTPGKRVSKKQGSKRQKKRQKKKRSDAEEDVQEEEKIVACLRVHPIQGSGKTKSGIEWGHTQFLCEHVTDAVSQRVSHGQQRLVIVLTSVDLFDTDRDLFIAGLASIAKGIAVFSVARYDPWMEFGEDYWYQAHSHPPLPMLSTPASAAAEHKKRTRVILRRACRIYVHEMLHLLQFDHCIFYQCLMNGSGHVLEDDSQPLVLCPVCLRKLCVLMNIQDPAAYQQRVEQLVRTLTELE
eukprot:gb/GEZN01005486.1/.p1 GENE.gb/GEZN01005486.1/~~gb/GEZN01005486.1/.p1  ORF type:complete len:502 (+),score=102.49 gb/GEZN01005486.1/:96-1601(+)